MVHAGGASVDDALVESAQLPFAHLLFADTHQQLGFHGYGIFAHAVAPGDLQRVDVMWAVGGDLQDSPAEGPYQVAIFALGVDDDNVIIGGQGDEGDKLFHCEGLA